MFQCYNVPTLGLLEFILPKLSDTVVLRNVLLREWTVFEPLSSCLLYKITPTLEPSNRKKSNQTNSPNAASDQSC